MGRFLLRQTFATPCYTTRAASWLERCYGIVQEHNGKTFCRNPEGGALLRVELPTGAADVSAATSATTVSKSRQPPTDIFPEKHQLVAPGAVQEPSHGVRGGI